MGEGRGGHYETLRETRRFHVELVVAATENSPEAQLHAALRGVTTRVHRCIDAAAVDRCLLAADRRADAIILWYQDAIWPPETTRRILSDVLTPTYLALPRRPSSAAAAPESPLLLHDGTVVGAVRCLAAKLGLAVAEDPSAAGMDRQDGQPPVRIERIGPVATAREFAGRQREASGTRPDGDDSPVARAAFIRVARFAALRDSAAGLAHEINNLVTPIAGYAQLLRVQVGPGDLAERLDIIENSAFRASRLIGELLTFMGSELLTCAPVEPAIWLARLVREMGPRIEEHGVRLVLSTPVELPSIFFDSKKMHEAVEHVIWNAVHAMEESGTGGAIQISAGITALRRDDYVRLGFAALKALDEAAVVPPVGSQVMRIDIVDEGPGVSADLIDRLFFPFVTTRGPERGRGLGLSVVYGIVRSHGGGVDLRSAPGQGTEVSMVIPIRLQAAT
jgi:signal transduction histidine kinase